MTTNPYAPPTAHPEAASEPPEKSIARRISILLAVVGFVGFWGTVVLCAAFAASANRVDDTTGLLVGVVMLLTVVTHIVGGTIAFAAVPEGRRLLPALLNAIPLALIIGLLIFAATTA